MTSPIRTTVLGPTGRLGSAICRALLDSPDFTLAGAVVRSESPAVGEDIGAWLGGEPVGCRAETALEHAVHEAQIVIDASLPSMTIAAAERLASLGGPALITGVTGFNRDQNRRLDACTDRIALLTAGNFSLGVAVTETLVREAARLPAEAWDIEVHETHHKRKADAPSGTALMLARAAAATRGETLENIATWSREGTTGPRKPGSIGFAVSRGGSVVGEHSVRFLAELEEITISHRALDRSIFARGALEAARWMVNGNAGRPAGHYSMQNVVAG
ncbi:4-hydroxy-tetrahydrodipicolinate reductase [Maricaulis sp. W15]|uniref:4-hydroxy-tetrahydrodipicolinate reductase n=1 Tax=Maricaulis maris TaxID=74318 RepID=A0A495D4D4_9PROT|nr:MULTISPECIES: 4-hydroxy-tetrahydrodipicolinate reductase [Maricaulis]OLF75466.1 4-hydroxy-tetrahydrodipicolinate reductase [Maricaulis sp. W15]RKQ96765.1 dihydrodipicolinate reductase [Maricaulis maris]